MHELLHLSWKNSYNRNYCEWMSFYCVFIQHKSLYLYNIRDWIEYMHPFFSLLLYSLSTTLLVLFLTAGVYEHIRTDFYVFSFYFCSLYEKDVEWKYKHCLETFNIGRSYLSKVATTLLLFMILLELCHELKSHAFLISFFIF